MIEGLEMDVQRTERDGIFTESEMNAYINKMSKSFFDVTASFILSAGKYPFRDVIVTTASTKIWMIRDLIEDLEHGYINIIKENLILYNLNVNDLLQNSNLKIYLEDEINNLIRLLLDEAKIIKQFPLRLKLFNFYTQIYYLPELFRVKEYSFDPRKVYNKIFKNECKAYYYSAVLSLKILLIEFF